MIVFRYEQGQRELLARIEKFARGRRVRLYAVGGMIRDALLRRPAVRPDFDFAIPRGSFAFGRALARHLKAAFVPLDPEHGACRIVHYVRGTLCTVDLSDYRGDSLEKDLAMRDFTVNAMAVSLRDLLTREDPLSALVDPLDGRADIRAGILKVTSEKALIDDPLRILRAFSLGAQLALSIVPPTRALLKKHAALLEKVSPERVRDELFKILESGCAAACIEDLDRLKILGVIFPEIAAMRGRYQGPYHHLDVWRHSMHAVRQLEQALAAVEKDERVRAHMDACLSSGRSRRALVKLAELFHDVAKPAAMKRQGRKLIFHGHDVMGGRMVAALARRLKLSNVEAEALDIMVRAHLRPGYLSDVAQPSPRALYRFFRDTRDEAVSVLVLSLGDQRATRGPQTTRGSHEKHERLVKRLLKEYFLRQEEVRTPRILNGNDIMKAFGLSPSPEVGKVLSTLDELQATGRIRTRSEALRAAKRLVSGKRK